MPIREWFYLSVLLGKAQILYAARKSPPNIHTRPCFPFRYPIEHDTRSTVPCMLSQWLMGLQIVRY